jgi:predicted metal-dependent phosphoesterase TrpH
MISGEVPLRHPVRSMIDLHSHSVASDGQYPAAEVAERAAAAGLTVWALTDHDTISGLPDGAAAAKKFGIEFVPGIELSVEFDRREIHLLGHFIDPDGPVLCGFSDLLAEKRRLRMGEIISKLAELGVPLAPEEVERFAGGKILGRPHVARALVERGIVATVREAFDRFLGEGRPAYVRRFRLDVRDAIRLVHDAGGTATLAHPGVNKIERGDLARLRGFGLDGVEVYHLDHNPSVRSKYLRAAAENELVATAGTDYHGEVVAPDRMFGGVTMPQDAFEALKSRRP